MVNYYCILYNMCEFAEKCCLKLVVFYEYGRVNSSFVA